jgi:hypothetical protein
MPRKPKIDPALRKFTGAQLQKRLTTLGTIVRLANADSEEVLAEIERRKQARKRAA